MMKKAFNNPYVIAIISGLIVMVLTITIQRIFFPPKARITTESRVTIKTSNKAITIEGSPSKPADIELQMKYPDYLKSK